MAGVFGDYSRLFRLFHVINFVGVRFVSIPSFASVIKRFVWGENPERELKFKKKKFSDTSGEQDSMFVAETASLLDLFPEVSKEDTEVFKSFHDFSVNCGNPIATILVSKQENCRMCKKPLLLDPNTHVVVIYDEHRGTYLGSRVTKNCNTCKVHEHYGYWTTSGKRQFETDCLENDFLLSSEDTAVGLSLIRQCANLLIVGAVAFSTYAKSYNRRFGYHGNLDAAGSSATEDKWTMKRKRRETPEELLELLTTRRALDRRRLEEAFLLFGCLAVMKKYNVSLPDIPCNRNELAQAITGKFHNAFVQRWGDHTCNKPGCESVLVLDGNMKNARQVCSCRDVGELKFDGMDGSVVVGCQNTPAKGRRYCEIHKDVAKEYVNIC